MKRQFRLQSGQLPQPRRSVVCGFYHRLWLAVADRRAGLPDKVAGMAGQAANRNWPAEAVVVASRQERAKSRVDNLLAVSEDRPVAGYRVKAEPAGLDKARELPGFAERGSGERQRLFFPTGRTGTMQHLAACLPDRSTMPV